MDRSPSPRSLAHARRPSRWPTALGFGVSAVLHLLVLLYYSSIEVRFGVFRPGDEIPGASVQRGIEIINLQEVEQADADRPAGPDLRSLEIPEAPPVVRVQPGLTPQAPVVPRLEPERTGSEAARRLQPSTNDSRLWQPLADDVVALTMEQRLENYLAGELLDLIDALAFEAARTEASTDWTYTDDEGKRWGISPGKLHLGSITLPLPFSFGTPAGASQDLVRRYLQDAEIRRAAGQLLTDQTLRERAQAIRARRDAERMRARSGSDSSVVRRRGGGGSLN
jgi:hypothetical protein